MLLAFIAAIVEFFETHANGITAIATAVIALFTVVLWLTSYWQWKVSRQTLILQFRPKLIVRNIVITEPVKRPTGERISFLTKDYPVTGWF